MVANRPAHLAIGIDCDGAKQVLGMWIGPSTGESAKFWLSVLSELKSRGVEDVCIVCCDGLTGLPDAIGVIWPQAAVQMCVVHLIRASLRYASKRDWTPLTQSLRPIYTAADEKAAGAALDAFAERWNRALPGDRAVVADALGAVHPVPDLPTGGAAGDLHDEPDRVDERRLRKVTRNRGQFPSEQAVLKVLYLAVRNLEEFRRPNVGISASGWKQALQASRSTSRGGSPPHERATITYTAASPSSARLPLSWGGGGGGCGGGGGGGRSRVVGGSRGGRRGRS